MKPRWVRYVAGASAAVAFFGVALGMIDSRAAIVALGISGAMNAFLAGAGYANGSNGSTTSAPGA